MRLAGTASADDVTILLIKHPFDTTALLLITGNASREVNWNKDETAHCKIHNVNVMRLNNNFYLTLACDIKKAWARKNYCYANGCKKESSLLSCVIVRK